MWEEVIKINQMAAGHFINMIQKRAGTYDKATLEGPVQSIAELIWVLDLLLSFLFYRWRNQGIEILSKA